MIKQISIDVYCEAETDVVKEIEKLISCSESNISVLGCDVTACWSNMDDYEKNKQI